ncbi:MAG: cation:proton antiporter [Nanoarchaeota archaeon]|nr:cation:proton antiporter [Nanoarchaeota archaeon]
MEVFLLKSVVIVFALAISISLLAYKSKIPSVVGFLITGILAGPHGFGLITNLAEVDMLAQIGIIVLLFTIGIEISLKDLLKSKKAVFVGGFLQVFLTILFTFLILKYFNYSTNESILIGFLVSLSSTAIVMKILQEKFEVDSPHGKASLGILIFQDIIAVLMILVIPILSGQNQQSISSTFFNIFIKGIVIITLVIICARWLIPKLFYKVAKMQSREIFLLSVIVVCFAVAWLTSSAGLSLALGAFLAGLILSGSEYGSQALSNILPFRDVFTSFFFISIGMLLNSKIFISNFLLVFSLTIAVILLKTLICILVSLLIKFSLRTSILVGFSLSQIGEFSFVLSKAGFDSGIISNEIYQLFLSISILSMILTPFIMMFAPKIADFASKIKFFKKFDLNLAETKTKHIHLKNHLVIIGFGNSGRSVASAAKSAKIDYSIIEMNPETVKKERLKGEKIYYGDAVQEEVLKQADIATSKVIVIVINDSDSTRRIVKACRDLNSKAKIIARTRFIKEIKPLQRLGADEVIPDEFETSIEIFSRVLKDYDIPESRINKFIVNARLHGYKIFTSFKDEKI